MAILFAHSQHFVVFAIFGLVMHSSHPLSLTLSLHVFFLWSCHQFSFHSPMRSNQFRTTNRKKWRNKFEWKSNKWYFTLLLLPSLLCNFYYNSLMNNNSIYVHMHKNAQFNAFQLNVLYIPALFHLPLLFFLAFSLFTAIFLQLSK